ncbi:MAG TPA: ubiquitin-like domain-containing protein [Candidatus Saccharimonadales bacterium]|nr:ubiquitin-like domain-containing protein [Candidatus Saccharimonadales bacterium]
MAMSEHITKKFTRTYLVGAVVALTLLGVIGVIRPRHHVVASNYTYVTVHYDGTEQTLATDAKTVGELLDRAKIPVDANDDIEPSKDTALISNDYNVNIYRARPIIVVDGASRYSIITAAQSPKQMAEAAGLTLYPEDKADISRVDDFVSDGTVGTKVTVDRAVPVSFALYGNPAVNRTQATTVGDFLHEKNITLQQGDSVSPSPATPITADMTIAVTHSGTQLVTVEEPIPFETQSINDADQPVGYKQVKTPGQNGAKLVTYEVQIENGKEVGRKVLNSITKTDPTKQIEVVGVKVNLPAGSHQDWMSAAGISAGDYGYVDYIISHESGWRYNAQGFGTTYGLCQAYPGGKMASAGADWQTNPVTQLKWCSGYATSRYGSWAAAYNHWLASHNW